VRESGERVGLHMAKFLSIEAPTGRFAVGQCDVMWSDAEAEAEQLDTKTGMKHNPNPSEQTRRTAHTLRLTRLCGTLGSQRGRAPQTREPPQAHGESVCGR